MNAFEISELWSHMGLVARGVLLVLAAMSVWSVTIAVERLRRYARAQSLGASFARNAQAWLAAREFDALLGAAQTHREGPLARVIAGAVHEYREGVSAREKGASYNVIDAAERAVDRVIEIELASLRRGLGGLASISSSAPFVGLFGTTFGIINSFSAIGRSGQGDLATVAPGIAEALVTTAFGIFVALPAVWLFNHFTARVDGFSVELRHAGNEVLDFIIKDSGRPQ